MAGLTFYAAFVIHTAAAVLGAESTVGFVTERVTNWSNLLGAIALPPLLIDHLRCRPAGRLRAITLLLWTTLLLVQVGLIAIHPAMDRLLNPADLDVLDPRRFRALHRIYLWLSTAEILSFPVYAACIVALWHRRDTTPPAR
jgi:hypothetical protein